MAKVTWKFVLYGESNNKLYKVKTLYSAKKVRKILTRGSPPVAAAKIKHLSSDLTFTCNNSYEVSYFLQHMVEKHEKRV